MLVEKLEHFMDDINMYQEYSQSHPVYQLIDKFYNDHYVIQYFSGLIGGKVDARIYMDCLIKQ